MNLLVKRWFNSIFCFHFQIREACQDLILDDKTLREIMSKFLHEIESGLKKKTHPTADVKCFVTYVQDLPNGKGEIINGTTNDDFSYQNNPP